jgi:hypothetical protein
MEILEFHPSDVNKYDIAVEQLSRGPRQLVIAREVRRVIIVDFVIFAMPVIEYCEQDNVKESELLGTIHNIVPGFSIPWRARVPGQADESRNPARRKESKIGNDNA